MSGDSTSPPSMDDAIHGALDEFLDSVKAIFDGTTFELKERGEALAAAAKTSMEDLLLGEINGKTAAENLRKLSDAVKSELLVAGYATQAKRMEIVAAALTTLMKITAAALA